MNNTDTFYLRDSWSSSTMHTGSARIIVSIGTFVVAVTIQKILWLKEYFGYEGPLQLYFYGMQLVRVATIVASQKLISKVPTWRDW